MFRLSQKADYGLILLSSVARAMEDKSKKYISISTVARKHQIPQKFLSQIATELKRAGMITAREGVAGGFTLAKRPQEIKLLDVLKLLDGGLFVGECFEDDHECTCGAGKMWKDVKKQLEETIGTKTVADLVGK